MLNATKAKTHLGQTTVKNYPVRDQLWKLMKENEREVVLQDRAYKDAIDWLLQAEKLAVAAIIEHHEKERKALLEARRFSTKERQKVMKLAWMSLDATRKDNKLGNHTSFCSRGGGVGLIPPRTPRSNNRHPAVTTQISRLTTPNGHLEHAG